VDPATNAADTSVTVYLDTQVDLKVNDIEEGTLIKTTDETINISGQADDDAVVTVNGYPVKMTSDGKFTEEVNLEMGENKIKVDATDQYGNKISKEYTVQRNEPPPPPPPPGPNLQGDGFGGLMLPLLLIIVIVIIVIVVAAVMKSRSKKARLAEEAEAKRKAEEAAAAQAAQQAADYQPSPHTTPAPAPVPAAPVAPAYPAQAEQPAYGYQQPEAQTWDQGGYQEQPYDTGHDNGYAQATATAVGGAISLEAQETLDRAERAVEAAESRGEETSKQRRNLKIAKMFEQKGNSNKVIHYATKALDFD
jgi:type II secretory pathway pseudopilin PulG